MVCDKGTVPVGRHEQQTPHTTLLQSALGDAPVMGFCCELWWVGHGVVSDQAMSSFNCTHAHAINTAHDDEHFPEPC
jgi:hypothetical protein